MSEILEDENFAEEILEGGEDAQEGDLASEDEALIKERENLASAQPDGENSPQNASEILSEFSPQNEGEILELIGSKKLSDEEISRLIAFNKKDIFIALARSQKLNAAHLEAMIPSAPYLAVELIIANQDYAPVREALVKKVAVRPEIYKELIAKYKEQKW
ncbi:hypothetical protein [uncultured Campylobacter sp.]|jgi:hypothetical protein|uniref:hypothetical protein n=1 Tax=uncultured Campylobacter sp. TaxID=218934 RepID=UPI0025F158F1|nr:hypothetical protein [uncultured Campylobacter sp.]